MKLLLRAENAAIFAASLLAYHLSGGSWWLFLALILVPDISMLAYLAGPRAGAFGYNMVHSWFAPVLFALIGWGSQSLLLVQLAIIVAAHISLDRMLGYGLKFATGFNDTHLGRIGH